MRGQITTYDSKKGEGRIQAEDGLFYRFNRDCLQKGEDADYMMMNVEVDFTPGTLEVLNRRTNEKEQWQAALEISVPNPMSAEELDVYYREPPTFLFEKEDIPDGYDVLDRGLYPITRSERTEEKAKNRLSRDCLDFGANSCVSYKCTIELKNAMGNGFNVYHASGVPVILATRDPNGDCRAHELQNRIDQEKVKKAHNILVNTRIGKMVIRGLMMVGLIIFALGFFLTGGI